MLELKKIVKDYKVADTYVHALKGISLNFRDNEFVSILGPSGCGKTTTLNIIGGLDNYTDGDLVINGVSTKTFKDRDWDVYRNHRIGFIFQSYNLIPHQNVLSNVELALTIAGVSKEERVARAKEALDRVGLKDQYYKKPNQLSGGQCQRVAIARALVNNPDILLADEPTGALDTVTSVQIMDLIREISSEKLVIMVTHNPELAEKYSTRIVKLLDGEVLEDSNPFDPETEKEEPKAIIANENKEETKEAEEEKGISNEVNINESNASIASSNSNKEKEKAKMSLWTAIKLSAKNLYSKFKRTAMVVIAGSIGIIGVSTVLSVSQGVKDYINDIQDDLLSGNPITVSETGIDLDSVTKLMSSTQKTEYVKKGDYVGVDSLLQYVALNRDTFEKIYYQQTINDHYLRYLKSMPKDYYSAIKFNYGIDVTASIYTDYSVSNGSEGERLSDDLRDLEASGNNTRNLSLNGISKQYLAMLANNQDNKQFASVLSEIVTPMHQCIDNNDYILSQYNIVHGRLPEKPEDILIVADSDRRVTDLTLGQLGYYSQNEAAALIYEASAKYEQENKKGDKEKAKNYRATYEGTNLVKKKFEYDELMSKDFVWYPNDMIYDFNGDYTTDPTYSYESKDSWQSGTVSEALANIGNMGIKLNVCGIVQPKKNINYGALSDGFLYTEDLARTIIKINSQSKMKEYVVDNEYDVNPNYGLKYSDFTYYDCLLNVNAKNADGRTYASIKEMSAEDINRLLYDTKVDSVPELKDMYLKLSQSGTSSAASMVASYMGDNKNAFNENTIGASYYPTNISIYPKSFDDKDLVTKYLKAWNDETKDIKIYNYDIETYEENSPTGDIDLEKYSLDSDGYYVIHGGDEADRPEVKFNDPAELIISIINSIINIVTYALVAFTALSLVVSTVMVGIITYVSVVERTNEIGVIRSLGGRKKDVSHLFNAESVIIGLASGIFGILVTGVICIFANVIVKHASDGQISAIARMTPTNIILMITISVVLTAISGIIPARAAARKDPVDALRTI